jgi:uncharacterized membrane protein
VIYAALIALIAAAFWGSADFISRKPSAKIGYYSASLFVQVFGFAGLAMYLTIAIGLPVAKVVENPNLLAVNIMIGIFVFGATVSLFRGYLIGVMSVIAPIASSYPILTILLTVALLGAVITLPIAIGISLVLVGMILAAIKLSELKSLRLRKTRNIDALNSSIIPSRSTSSQSSSTQETTSGTINATPVQKSRVVKGVDMGVITFLFLGATFFGLAILSGTFGQLFPVMLMRGVAAITALCLFIPLKQKLRLPSGRALVWLVLLSGLDTSAYVLYNYSAVLAGQSLPIVVALSAQFSAVTIMLARAFYKEKLELIQYVGIGVILFGIGITLYF